MEKVKFRGIKKMLSRDEMKQIKGGCGEGTGSGAECSANCNPGFVTIDSCSAQCTATTDVGVKCGTVTKCCSGGTCNP